MSTENQWVRVTPTRTRNGPAVTYRVGTGKKKPATVRFNAAAVDMLGLKRGQRLVVFAPAIKTGNATLALGFDESGTALNGRSGALQCGAAAFKTVIDTTGKRVSAVKWVPEPVAGSKVPMFAILKPVQTEFAP